MGLTLKKLSLMPYIVYLAFFSLDIGRLPVLKRPTESSIYLEVFVLFVVVYSKGFFLRRKIEGTWYWDFHTFIGSAPLTVGTVCAQVQFFMDHSDFLHVLLQLLRDYCLIIFHLCIYLL